MEGLSVAYAIGWMPEDAPGGFEVTPTLSFAFHREKDDQGRLMQKTFYSTITFPVNAMFRFPLRPEQRKRWCLMPFAGIHGRYAFMGWDKYYDAQGNKTGRVNWFAEVEQDDDDDYFYDWDASRRRSSPTQRRATKEEDSEEEEETPCLDGERYQFGVQWGIGVQLGKFYIGYQWEENLTHIWSHNKTHRQTLSIGISLYHGGN
jgi:hypothetical protein